LGNAQSCFLGYLQDDGLFGSHPVGPSMPSRLASPRLVRCERCRQRAVLIQFLGVFFKNAHNDTLSLYTCSGRESMSRGSIGRVILAVLGGYIANAILVAATEQLLSLLIPGVGATPPFYYFVFDVISQCLYTVAGGFLCCLIAGPSQQAALAGLIALGVLVGTVFLVGSWKTEPHWYGIALVVVYSPCVWIGWTGCNLLLRYFRFAYPNANRRHAGRSPSSERLGGWQLLSKTRCKGQESSSRSNGESIG
jgi:hypothetical protein